MDVYIERTFCTPLTAADERALSRRLASAARAYPVRWRECLVNGDRTRILCRLDAESLPAARAAALCLGVKCEGAWLSALPWTVTTPAGMEGPTATPDGSLVDVMAEWRLPASVDALRFSREQHACDRCLDAFRVRPGSMATSADGRRVVAFFRAPDAEAVRNAYRHATVPFHRVTGLRRLDRSA